MTTRDTVLGRIRAALADVPASESPDDVPVPRDYRRSHAEPDAVAQFAARVADYRATVTRTTEADACATVAARLAARGLRTLVVPDGFPAGLLPEGGAWTVLRDEPPLSVAELDAAEGVLTTAALGIAVTGTIVLDAGPGQGRRALTLLPDYHLCVVREDQIAGDVPEALGRVDATAPLTWISGPSATSDIELDRVEGVHGPRTLDVIVVGGG
ncbi:LUD domain-containing protein [Streptomyces sp. ISL-98]|uniref:LutC/YkgG family protein n=1 Tax=Streptomyces sp. ISL-98 TaxID=2819192 RepID=UPI001BECA403|nr:LUD domain-containing protein [Streptomyces sp. ISL-98]MBT2505016.1 LUD domain-containing protein [Streptomyces sp. ISL-98]